MKWLLLIVLCFGVANAFASPADSGRCPWKMPFTIIVDGVGTTRNYGYSRTPVTGGYIEHSFDSSSLNSNESFQITIDTTPSRLNGYPYIVYSLKNEVLQFKSWLSDTNHLRPTYGLTSVIIKFDRNKDSIISLSFWETDTMNVYGNTPYLFWTYHFEISSLRFNDTSIFTSDSLFRNHNTAFTSHIGDSAFNGWNSLYYDFSDFTAVLVTVSGLFQATTFSDRASLGKTSVPVTGLSFSSSRHVLTCAFDRAEYERSLEVYSLLGIKVATVNIPPNEKQISLPLIQPGFYFVRLEGVLRKVYVAE